MSRRHLRVYRIDADDFAAAMISGRWIQFILYSSGELLPKDAKLVEVGYEPQNREIRLTFEHESFYERMPTCAIDMAYIRIVGAGL